MESGRCSCTLGFRDDEEEGEEEVEEDEDDI